MLGTLFSHLCPLGVPAGDKIWESTRLCLPQRHGAERRRTLRNALISALVDVALARGLEQYTGLIPDPFSKDVLALGWQRSDKCRVGTELVIPFRSRWSPY